MLPQNHASRDSYKIRRIVVWDFRGGDVFLDSPTGRTAPLMAKYGKEQRYRAVDLYIKYERNAAGAIRELGYPSRGSL